MNPTEDRCRGALVGLALGDALGATQEDGLVEHQLWCFLGSSPEGLSLFKDDTPISIDLAQSLISLGMVDQDNLSTRFSKRRSDVGHPSSVSLT